MGCKVDLYQIANIIKTRALVPQLFEDKSVCSESDPVNSHIGNQTDPTVNAPCAK